MTPKRLFSGVLCLATLSLLFGGIPARAAVSGEAEVEVLQTQATLEYHSKQYDKATQTLRQILSKETNNVAALEMLALIQRSQKDDKAATQTYERLIKIGPAAKKGAYNFELASILYKQKKFAEARKYFAVAADAKFNPGTSNFFLGVMDFDGKKWREARNHLSASLTYTDADNMAPVTRYYLASTYAQLGKSDAAIRNYHEAEVMTAETGSDAARAALGPMLNDVHKNALKELKSYDKNQRQLSLSLMSQWDSNVQTNPSEVENKDAQSSQRSLKTVISANAAYVTSPTKMLQVTPSYNFYTNYNMHYLARDYNFITHSPAVYAMYKPYSKLAVGGKVGGTFSMKNNLSLDDERWKLKYRPFSLTGDLGPVVRYELTPRINLVGEVFWRPKKYYLDPATGDSRRTGEGLFSRISGDFISGFSWWNPAMYASFEWDHPVGRTFRVYSYGFGLSNAWQLSDKLVLTPFFDLLASDYYDFKTPKRDDVNMSVRVAASYAINAKWSGLADVGYTNNDSNISTSFKYNRFVVTGGATYAF